MALIIRDLDQADFARGFLETLAHLASVDLEPEEAIAIWQQRSAAGIRSIVAELDGVIVGTASLIVEKKFIHRGGLVGHIEDVAVRSDQAGHGIGSALLQHLTELAASLHCYKVILNCLDSLTPFYGRAGFRRHDSGMRRDLPGGK